MEDGGSNLLHMVLEELHHCIHGNHRAMDGNSHMYSVSGFALSESISHSCNEEGFPHPRPGGSHHSDTGSVYMCAHKLTERSLIPKATTTNKYEYAWSLPVPGSNVHVLTERSLIPKQQLRINKYEYAWSLPVPGSNVHVLTERSLIPKQQLRINKYEYAWSLPVPGSNVHVLTERSLIPKQQLRINKYEYAWSLPVPGSNVHLFQT